MTISPGSTLAEIRKGLVLAQVAKPMPSHNGKALHATGKVSIKERQRRPYLENGSWLVLDRHIAMYQSIEDKGDKTKGRVDSEMAMILRGVGFAITWLGLLLASSPLRRWHRLTAHAIQKENMELINTDPFINSMQCNAKNFVPKNTAL